MTIDEKYIDKLCLPNISKVKDGVYRFRCVYCSLIETNPKKWKGYLYLKGNSYNYCCHICNHRSSLSCDEGIEPKPVQKISIRNISGCFPTKSKILT